MCGWRGGRKIKWEEQCFNEGLAWERDDLLEKFSWLFPGTLMRGFFCTNRQESGECLPPPPVLDADGNWKNCPSRVHKTSSFLPFAVPQITKSRGEAVKRQKKKEEGFYLIGFGGKGEVGRDRRRAFFALLLLLLP